MTQILSNLHLNEAVIDEPNRTRNAAHGHQDYPERFENKNDSRCQPDIHGRDRRPFSKEEHIGETLTKRRCKNNYAMMMNVRYD